MTRFWPFSGKKLVSNLPPRPPSATKILSFSLLSSPIILPFSSVTEIPTGTGISQYFPLDPFSALTHLFAPSPATNCF